MCALRVDAPNPFGFELCSSELEHGRHISTKTQEPDVIHAFRILKYVIYICAMKSKESF